MSNVIPVILFAYARPDHLARVLACLRDNAVPLIYAYADGARRPDEVSKVSEVRALLRAVDWCEIRLIERDANLGLGRSILAGVTEVAASHEAFIVWEDDLICVPGTYAWLAAALRHYATAADVFSVSAWTHPRVTPSGIGNGAYLDGRAECWVWGAYARSWQGMDEPALLKLQRVRSAGLRPDAYGVDLPPMAEDEQRKNIWAVRWLYHHIQHGKLCVRPPWSMVEHIGFDAAATNAVGLTEWANPPLKPAPPSDGEWPQPGEHPECRRLWVKAAPGALGRLWRRFRVAWLRA